MEVRFDSSVVQFNLTSKLAFSPLDESGFPSAVNTLFAIAAYVIDILTNKVRNEESCGVINLGFIGAACCCGHSRGAAAEESPADRIPGCYCPFQYLGPHRGIPPRSPRSRLHRR